MLNILRCRMIAILAIVVLVISVSAVFADDGISDGASDGDSPAYGTETTDDTEAAGGKVEPGDSDFDNTENGEAVESEDKDGENSENGEAAESGDKDGKNSENGEAVESGDKDGNESGNKDGSDKKLTKKQKEALAVAKYGTYKGKNATKIPVITYHKVVTDKQKKSAKYRGSGLAVSKSSFDKQMKWLHKNGYRTINCEEFYLWHEGKIKLPKKTVLITFDDGRAGVVDNALPVLKKYGMKGTVFIIGKNTYTNKKDFIKYKTLLKVQKEYPDMEFQSHTYNLHKFFSKKGDYNVVLKDAEKQKKIYGFEYLAYPYGRNTKGMIKAYKKSGIKMAFAYGDFGYATRKQDLFKIRRIKIRGGESMSSFKKWFK